jgi:hypothetical protein
VRGYEEAGLVREYEFTAPYHEICVPSLFLGFANNDTEQYFWMQRGECTEDEVLPYAENVWIERDDQQWGGSGGITRVNLSRDKLSVELTKKMASHMGGYDLIRVLFVLTDEEFAQVQEQLLRIMQGYQDMVEVRV